MDFSKYDNLVIFDLMVVIKYKRSPIKAGNTGIFEHAEIREMECGVTLVTFQCYSMNPAAIITLSTTMDDIHTAQREDAAKDDGVKITAQPHPTLEEYERLFGVDEDAYEQPTTTRKELWSYYLYYNGAEPFVGRV